MARRGPPTGGSWAHKGCPSSPHWVIRTVATDEPKRRRPPTRGTDAWREHGGEVFCHWDRWYLAVLLGDHDGSWAALEAPFWELLDERMSGFDREDAESKLHHGADLRARLDRAGVSPDDLLGGDGDDRALLRKARAKLYERRAMDAYPTEAMQDTPRRRYSARALRGCWHEFPVSPARFDEVFMEEVTAKRSLPRKSAAALARRLDQAYELALAEHEHDADTSLAVRRAFLTALLEALRRADDSYGELGGLLQSRLSEYCGSGPGAAAIDSYEYLRDLLQFCIWEDQGCRGEALRSLFARVDDRQALWIEDILNHARAELVLARLDHHAEKELTIRGELHVTRGDLDRFVGLARKMGSREWKRITTMAEAALEAGDRGLAIRVFEAANQPGFHDDFLRTRCHELTGHTLPEPRHLKVVP